MNQKEAGTQPGTKDAGARNEGLHDAMWRGHGGWEMALTPVLFGFLGHLLDGRAGTAPLFLVAGVVLGFLGSVANQYFQYNHRMEIATEARRAARQAETETIDGGGLR